MNGPTLAKNFASKWRQKYGESLLLPYQAAAAFFKQRIAAGTSPERLLAAMDHFFAGTWDSFVQRRRHDFVAFRAAYNAVMASLVEAEKKKVLPAGVAENYERLEAARARTDDGEKP